MKSLRAVAVSIVLLFQGQPVFAGLIERFLKPFDDLMRLDLERDEIKLKMAALEFEASELRQHQLFRHSEQKACDLLSEALEEGGDIGARTIASLEQWDPKWNSREKYFFALEKIKQNQFNEAAQAFLGIVGSNQNETEPSRKNLHYWLGFIFYQLRNYRTSLFYLNQFLEGEKGPSLLHLKALAWKGLAHGRLKQKGQAQKTFHQVLQAYPNSRIARRLSGKN